MILADNSPNWRPNRNVRELAGTRTEFRFHAIKLLDLDESFLRQAAEGGNPAALMLLAFRRAIGTGDDVQARFEARKQLIALMMEHGYNWDTQAQLLRLMEWILMLPETLERAVDKFIEEYKREMDTPFVSRLEKCAIEQGLAEGIAEGQAKGLRTSLTLVLSRRFGSDSAEAVKTLLEKISAPTLSSNC